MARHEAAIRAALDAGAADAAPPIWRRASRGRASSSCAHRWARCPGRSAPRGRISRPGAVLTDAGSVKRSVVEAARGCPARADVELRRGPSDGRLRALRLRGLRRRPLRGEASRSSRRPQTRPSRRSRRRRRSGRVSAARCDSSRPRPTTIWSRRSATCRIWPPTRSCRRRRRTRCRSSGAASSTRRGSRPPPSALWTDIFRENRQPLLDALARYEAVLARWREPRWRAATGRRSRPSSAARARSREKLG